MERLACCDQGWRNVVKYYAPDSWVIGLKLEPIRFCPWCGHEIGPIKSSIGEPSG